MPIHTSKLTKDSHLRILCPNRRLDVLILSVVGLLGGMLRFINLESKPPWADEWATLVFSLGNSFLTIPLDRGMDFATLMQPLQVPEAVSIGQVIHNLLTESTHPPVYFVLTHLWVKLFATEGMVSVGLARSLSVLCGILGIFGIFYLTKLIANRLCAHFAAVLIAFSPYGVYLAQETRHYTFAILLVMASVGCLTTVIEKIQQQKPVANSVVLSWIVVNSLGVATHYFFALSLVTQILVLSGWLWKDLSRQDFNLRSGSPWRSVLTAVLGTVAGCSVWVWTWLQIPENQLTDWTKHGDRIGWEFFEPIGRIFGWLTTMVMLLPIEGTPIWVTVSSGIVVLGLTLWLIGQSIKYWREEYSKIAFSYTVIALGLILAFAYLGDRDLTLAARFQFFYFPVFLVLMASVLSFSWEKNQRLVSLIIAIAFCGSLTVVTNYGYQKPDRADLVVPVIAEAQSLQPDIPVVLAIVHKHHEQTGEMMSIAWEWLRKVDPKVPQPKVILLHKQPDLPEQAVTQKFIQQLATLPRPLNVWVVNFSAPTGIQREGCTADLEYKRRVAGYRFRLYHCQ